MTEQWRILHIFTPETWVWLHSSPLSHFAAPSVMSVQRMIRRSWFPDIITLCCSVWTVPLEAMAAVFLVFHQHSDTNTGQTMKVIIGTAGAIFPSPACYPHCIMYGTVYDFRVNVQSTTLCINLWASCKKLQSLKGWKAIKGSVVMLKLCHLTPARRNISTCPLHVYIIYRKDLKHNESCRGEQNACVFCMADCISTAAVVLYISAGSF